MKSHRSTRIVFGAGSSLLALVCACAPGQSNDALSTIDPGRPDVEVGAFFVSSSTGDDAGPGTRAQPWKSLAKASERVYLPGERLLLRRGDVWVGEELVLTGDGDPAAGAFITLQSYGEGPKPRITAPPQDLTPGLVDWTAVNAAIPGTNRSTMSIAVKLDAARGGWVIRELQIDHAEMGIYGNRFISFAHVTIEDCDFHDIDGLRMPKTPTFDQDSTMWSPMPEPPWGSAIALNGENVTIRDVVVERATGAITGWMQSSTIENVHLEKIWAGGLNASGLTLTMEHCTVLDAQWPDGAWFGVDPVMPNSCTDYHVRRSEIAGTHIFDHGGDAAGIDFDALNVDCSLVDSFVHDNYGPAVELHLAGENHHIAVTDCVFLANGFEVAPELGYEEPSFLIDAGVYSPGSTVALERNQIYERYVGQYLNIFYTWTPPYFELVEDFSHVEDDPDYTIVDNTIVEAGDYTLPLPIPPPATEPREDLALAAAVALSSGAATAAQLVDGDLATEWISSETFPVVRLSWPQPQSIDTVRLHDRAALDAWCTSAELRFSDGSIEPVTGGLLNNGALREVRFQAREITWLELVVVRGTGSANGFATLSVHPAAPPGPDPLPPDVGTFTVDFQDRPSASTRLTGAYPLNAGAHNAIDWRRADWTTSPNGAKRFLHVDFPGLTYAFRMFELPPGKVLKGLRVSGPAGSMIAFSMAGQSDGFVIEPQSGWTHYDVPFIGPAYSTVVAVSIYAAPGFDVNSVRLDDLTFGD